MSAPTLVTTVLEERIAHAIRSSDHCPLFLGGDDEDDACDGLDGCAECLRLAARAVLAELAKDVAA